MNRPCVVVTYMYGPTITAPTPVPTSFRRPSRVSLSEETNSGPTSAEATGAASADSRAARTRKRRIFICLPTTAAAGETRANRKERAAAAFPLRMRELWENRPDWARGIVVGLIASLVALLVLFALAVGYLGAGRPGRQIGLSQLRELGDQGRVRSAVLRDEDAVLVARVEAG